MSFCLCVCLILFQCFVSYFLCCYQTCLMNKAENIDPNILGLCLEIRANLKGVRSLIQAVIRATQCCLHRPALLSFCSVAHC